jgi:biopolymer transport protein ExbD
MSAEERRSADRGIAEVNMTPLIDVSLVLVVMLMLTSPLAFEQNISVRRAAQSAQAAEVTEPVERIELTILSDTEVQVNRDRLPREELSSALEGLLNHEVPPQVVVACENEVSHGTFVQVLDLAKFHGASDIAVVEDRS